MAQDSYTEFVNTGLGKKITKALGLPQPAKLRRYRPDAPSFTARWSSLGPLRPQIFLRVTCSGGDWMYGGTLAPKKSRRSCRALRLRGDSGSAQ